MSRKEKVEINRPYWEALNASKSLKKLEARVKSPSTLNVIKCHVIEFMKWLDKNNFGTLDDVMEKMFNLEGKKLIAFQEKIYGGYYAYVKSLIPYKDKSGKVHAGEISGLTARSRLSAVRRLMSAWLIEMPKVVADAYKLEHIYADNNKAMPSREDFQAMLAPNAKYGNLRSRTLLVLLLSSGIRIGEALNLKWGDIDLEAEPLTIKLRAEITKFNRERWTFATPECRDFLVKLREWYKSEGAPCGEDDYIFVTHNSKKEWGPVVYASQYKALRELFKNVKNEKGKSRYKFFPHLLRAVFKSWAMEGGMSEDLANKLCGHRTYMQEYDLRNGVEEYKRAVPKLTIFPTPEDEFEKLAREMTNMSKEQFEALIMKVTKLRSEAGMRLICPSDGAELRRQIVITLIKRSLSRGDSVVDKLVDEAMQKEIQPERLEELERAEQSAARVLKHLNNRTM